MGILIVIIWFAFGFYTFFTIIPLCDKKIINIIGLFLICTTGGALLVFADVIIGLMRIFLPENWETLIGEVGDKEI